MNIFFIYLPYILKPYSASKIYDAFMNLYLIASTNYTSGSSVDIRSFISYRNYTSGSSVNEEFDLIH